MGVAILMSSTLNALVVVGYMIFGICFHWGEVNRGLLNFYIYLVSLFNAVLWIGMAVLARADVVRGPRVTAMPPPSDMISCNLVNAGAVLELCDVGSVPCSMIPWSGTVMRHRDSIGG